MTHENSKILIVGGNSGMGLALAQRCLDEGARVIIVGRNREKLNLARKSLLEPPRLETIQADITDESQVVSLFEQIGELNHIVCTAADIQGAYELLSSLDIQAVQRAIESKVLGPLLLAKYGAPRLMPKGSITLTSGIAAYRPLPRGAVVATINAALEGLVRALAVELAPLRVNAVSPGWIDTPIWNFVAGDKKDETLAAMAKRLLVGRVGCATDIAEAIEFLMSNTFTTGTVLQVEGGHRLI
ncbi:MULTISPECIES: SDR family oxidoreductase [unclassified Serratia (in: enterobacteria)]|uniref:SDR family oxidoreductase n=1 Tax=unclassified Serratia (in: enterobacteria) TaxID=2647522 RepID=UPI000506CA7B|nr:MULTISPECIES: SDR family oxidoreductase [unclassified Serratia (in: enterobacteria)]KFK93150.1 short-chain dehydrogenase [Serratia sp. Ag2]KFK99589.1 short-chain dehydrogenase [Serratia sp. Ag1]